jgi:hypothetical protein
VFDYRKVTKLRNIAIRKLDRDNPDPCPPLQFIISGLSRAGLPSPS